MPTSVNVGIIANMDAQLITRFKDITSDGAILEVVIWKVPAVHKKLFKAIHNLSALG